MASYKFTERKSQFFSINDSIDDFLKSYKLENRYLQTLAMTKWEILMGPAVVTRTEKIFFKEDTMFIKIKSAPLKHQLSMSKTKIKDMLNEEIGKIIINEILFL